MLEHALTGLLIVIFGPPSLVVSFVFFRFCWRVYCWYWSLIRDWFK